MVQIDWVLAGSIVFTGITVVFAILVFLWGSINMIGKIVVSLEKPKKENELTLKNENVQSNSNEINSDIIAVIVATVESVVEGNYAIKSITKKDITQN